MKMETKRSVGVCAMDIKSNTEQMRRMVEVLKTDFDVKIFAEKMVQEETIENWPTVDVLIAFYSHGYPLDKVKKYAELRKPWLPNDLCMQKNLMDRTKVYDILIKANVDVPRYAVAWRGDANHPDTVVTEEDDEIDVGGVKFKKPFVEKPVSAEDHNVIIYYPSKDGGGCKHLFRKTKEQSSTFLRDSKIRRDGSYLYEDFVQTNGIDVKVYAVGEYHAYAEARTAPGLDGKVKRDEATGKEIRYPVGLTEAEKEMARKIVKTFHQMICGFDLLRATVEGRSRSVVCDVNGFSFVKSSRIYYEHTAKIMRDKIRHKYGISPEPVGHEATKSATPATAGSDRELRCVLAVIRHGDRTPKQKLKMTVTHGRWFDLLKKYGRDSDEAKVKKAEHLQEVLDTVRALLAEQDGRMDDGEREKLEQVKTVLEMHGSFVGVNRKVQIKRNGVAIRLTVKWGGELTKAGAIQAEAMGKRFRHLYPNSKGSQSGTGFLRLHNTYRHDLKTYASEEGRVQMTAAAFVKGLLSMDAVPAHIRVHMVESVDMDSLLDNDDKAARAYQEECVKKRLKDFFHQNRDFTEHDRVMLNPTRSEPMEKALRAIGNPRDKCERLWCLMVKLTGIIASHSTKSEGCEQKLDEEETWKLAENRWKKLYKEFRRTDESGAVIYEIAKIQDIYDMIKYDLEHNEKSFKGEHTTELYECAKLLADVVVPQEYGIERDEKYAIGRSTCTPLMKKLISDLNACNGGEKDEGDSTSLDPEGSEGIESPTRRVRTRLYFTSKSHLHGLMNVVRYGNFLPAEDEQWKRANDFLSRAWECNYMAQVVILVYEKQQPATDDDRFHAELHFSPGILPDVGVDHLKDESFVKLTSEDVGKKERLISTAVIDQGVAEDFVKPRLPTTAVIQEGSSSPVLWTAAERDLNNVTTYLPPIQALTALSNRLSPKMLIDFFKRVTNEEPMAFLPKK